MPPRFPRFPAVWLQTPVFATALFLSSFAFFWVQPMLGKMLLPAVGGAPAVWSAAMLFFQLVLLGGYLYAHAIRRWLPWPSQPVVHLALLAAVLTLLPPIALQGERLPPGAQPALWTLAALAKSIGLPCLLLASSAPLLQGWYARSPAEGARDPYFLYGASNAGSLAALILFPALIEPRWPLPGQAAAWKRGLILVAALQAAAAVAVRIGPLPGTTVAPAGQGPAEEAPGWPLRLRWMILALVPASLLLGVTMHVSTDVAPVPLFWVVPLALYLLTYIAAFARRPPIPHPVAVAAQAPLLLLLAVSYGGGLSASLITVPLHLAAFTATALVCHGELAAARPAQAHLTQYYLWLAVGGLAGGAFNALLAPSLFGSIVEYPLMIAVAGLLRPRSAARGGIRRRAGEAVAAAALAAALAAVAWRLRPGVAIDAPPPYAIGALLAAVALAAWARFRRRPVPFALSLSFLLVLGHLLGRSEAVELARVRNFFGVITVESDPAGRFHTITHGSTVHGAQATAAGMRSVPLAYHHPDGPLGWVFDPANGRPAPGRIAVIGLGAGAVAAYGLPGQAMTFFEIDPDVARIAADPALFTYLRDSRAQVEVVLGDARLTLAERAGPRYDLIILDAFSSDAIPLHLLTREAFRTYLARLAPGGLLALHVSNRFLDLEPPLARLAAGEGLVAMASIDVQRSPSESIDTMRVASDWIVMARSMKDVGYLPLVGRWRPAGAGKPAASALTDEFSNVFGLIRWREVIRAGWR